MPFSVPQKKYCDFFTNGKFFYDDLLAVSDLPAKGVCPWPKGNYTIRGNALTFKHIPPHFNGDYKLEGIIKKNNIVMNGYQIFINFVNPLN